MAYSQITYEVSRGIATVTLNRPKKLNAFTNTMMRELLDVFDVVDADDDVRVVIVTGAGRGFCAGADLSGGGETFARGGSDEQTDVGIPRDGGGMVSLRIFECKKPVIAAINGAAVGVGATMTLPMDIAWLASAPSSVSCSLAAGSCPMAARHGSFPAWWESAKPQSGVTPVERDRRLLHMAAAVERTTDSESIRATLMNYFGAAAEQLRNDTGLPISSAKS